jgi:hypothetical protein
MNTKKLILIGGIVVLGGLYFADKKTKDKAKADADAQVLAEALKNAQPKVTTDSSNTKLNTSFFGGVTPQECAKLGKKYKEVQVNCITTPCPSFGICE